MKLYCLSKATFDTITQKATSHKQKVSDSVIKYRIYYPNGYGASIIKSIVSSGGESNLWELAILKEDCLCYDTEIANRVLGFLTERDVISICEKISSLK